jgi:Oxidoreductase molybdopterin binding domain
MTRSVSLSICGDVERPACLALAELRSLMDAELVADFHCHEGWSRLGERWRGVRLRTLLALAGAAADGAGYVTAASGEYTAVLTREQAEDERVLLALEHEGAASPRRAGGSRLVGPSAWDCFLTAGDVDTAARMVEELWLPFYRQARITTLQRWFRWLEDRGGIEGHPLAAAYASQLAGTIGWPAEAERWVDVADRWQSRNADQPGDPFTEATAAANRAILCRRGVQQMCDDADEAAQKYAAAGIVMPVTGAVQGIARVLSGDLDAADVFFEETIAAGRDIGAPPRPR